MWESVSQLKQKLEFLLSYVGVTDVQATASTTQAKSAWSSASAAVLSCAPGMQPTNTSTHQVKPPSHTIDVLAAVHNEL